MSRQPYLNTEYLGFLVDTQSAFARNNPLLKKEVRQAINLAFDRRKMMRYLRNNIGYPAEYGFVPIGMPNFRSNRVKGYSYNPAEAARLLAAAGYPGGKGLPELVLTTTGGYLDLCEFIQRQVEQVGIRIRIEMGTGGSFLDMVANARLPFFRGSWVADYPDPENYLALFYSGNHSPGGPNYTHFSNPEFDQLYLRSFQVNNDSLRGLLCEKADQLIMDAAPVVPLYYDQVVRFTSKKVKGMESNPLNLLILKQIDLDPLP